MKFLKFFLLLNILIFQFTYSQSLSNAFKVIHGIDTLAFPWTGGFDNPRFNNLDLNQDGKQDLVIFDRKDQKLLTFIHIGNPGEVKYRLAPEYIPIFPKDINNWMLILDYNCDNQPDIFTRQANPPSIVVYKNTTLQNGYLSFESTPQELWSKNVGQTSGYPLPSGDIPAIADIDLDGDIDLLVQDGLGARLEFHRNVANICGDWDLELHSMCWGHFVEVSDVYAGASLNQPCFGEYKTLHAGGAYLALQLNGDTLIDLILTDDGPNNAVALINGGSRRFAHITQKDTFFPSYNTPIHLHYFPALYHVDIDADGIKDLVAAVNGIDFPSPSNPTYVINWGEAAHFYKNTGTSNYPHFQLQKKDILFDQTIDGGSHSVPLLWDEDKDNDLDLLILIQQKTIWTGSTYAQRKEWRFYENITDNFNPVFKLVTSNYKGFNNLTFLDNLKVPYPALADIDNDGDQDLFVGHYDGKIVFMENIATTGSANFQLASTDYLGMPLTGKGCFPHFADVDNDNDLDLIIGRENGKITFVENIGTPSSPTWANPIDQWKGIDVSDFFNPFVAYAKPFWFDYNQDGNPELLVGNFQGEIHIYEPSSPQFHS
ncbi:MAG: hypothetical protein KatS3mg083_570 [Candidatus Dojkabacteria bacterium]|nr:MAG: hypothetical protein KatS3mg083_570 [Candidatus Dojkabacteria bacterium]